MSRPSNAKAQFIETAINLFRRSGYHAVGLTEIIAASGAPKGSFYHHFPGGKEELADYAVRGAGRVIAKAIDEAFLNAATFEDGAQTLAAKIANWCEASNFMIGCPITPMLLELTPVSTILSARVKEVFNGWGAEITKHAERLGVGEASGERAERLLIALEGAWLIARMRRSRAPLMMAARMA